MWLSINALHRCALPQPNWNYLYRKNSGMHILYPCNINEVKIQFPNIFIADVHCTRGSYNCRCKLWGLRKIYVSFATLLLLHIHMIFFSSNAIKKHWYSLYLFFVLLTPMIYSRTRNTGGGESFTMGAEKWSRWTIRVFTLLPESLCCLCSASPSRTAYGYCSSLANMFYLSATSLLELWDGSNWR